MHPDEIIFHKIEDYLRDRLSPQDRAAFESDMAADAELAALVQRQKQENQALELLAERDLRARMNAWERQMPATLTPAGGRYRLKWVRWAAAAMVVFAAGWWLIRQTGPVEAPVAVQPETPATSPKTTPAPKQPERRPKTETPKEVITDASKRPAPVPKTTPPAPVQKTVDYAALADEFYRERDFFPAGQSTGSGAAGYDQALQDFKKGKYSDILPKLRPGGKLDSKDLKTKELLAHSLLKSGQYDAAIAAFREIVNTRKQPYADKAEWAMALTYLRQMPGKSAELDRALSRIVARPGHLFYGSAMALRERLEKER